MTAMTGLFAHQNQSIAISAEVIQSIKLLQFSHEELEIFLREQADRNPFIELALPKPVEEPLAAGDGAGRSVRDEGPQPDDGDGLRGGRNGASVDRFGRGAGAPGTQAGSLEDYVASAVTLREHLRGQIALSFREPVDEIVATEIVESLDADGYLRRDVGNIADLLGLPDDRVASVLSTVQTFDPPGIAARCLSECLRLQLEDRGPVAPAMSTLLDNLPLLASFEMRKLSRLCRVDEDEVLAMAKAIRALDPRPGMRFDRGPLLPALPDVLVDTRPDGSCALELNAELMPRVLLDRTYASEISAAGLEEPERRYVGDCLRNANWLTKNLNQRAVTILKVATEIVAQQQAFFRHGVQHLRPLNLKDVADAVGLHQSTVCRATSNKYMMTNRGLFELKFFFTNSIGAANGNEDFSAETVRHKIKGLIRAERHDAILSDEAIVFELRKDGVDIARRTVAKYREILRIPTAIRRRKQKSAEHAGARGKTEWRLSA